MLRKFLLIAAMLELLPWRTAAQTHKVEIRDKAAQGAVQAAGGRLVADYGGFKLYDVPASLANAGQNRDVYNSIFLNAAVLNTSLPAVQALRVQAGEFSGKRMHLVHFAGPIQPAWRRALLDTGAQIVSYIPENTYLIYGDTAGISRVQTMAAATPVVQWDGRYLDDYKINPRIRGLAEAAKLPAAARDFFAIQLVADAPANAETMKLIGQLQLEPPRRHHAVMNMIDIIVRVPTASVARLAARPDVVSIMPYGSAHKEDERQDQIVADNISGNVPSGPGYLAWLESKGFNQAQFTASGFIVDISDSGIDNGTTMPNHFGLYANGGISNASRVAYNILQGTPNPGSTLAGCDGHGNLNTHIVAGFDNSSGFPFADESGYHYGLGVCPFAAVGSSVIFDPDLSTDPDDDTVVSTAYQEGARISNNSWGDSYSDGQYNMDSFEYDGLVRDAQPGSSIYPTAGNQEMVIIFAAGNDGPESDSVSPPATAKNVISVGAADNVQLFGGCDGSDVCDSDADNADAIVGFSGRGPCNDGRRKPDLVAPGTHVSGGVPQENLTSPVGVGQALDCFLADGDGVSGGVATNGGTNLFFPDGQQFYTASSGTSHSTPCVTGGCALVRQYFINNSNGVPSPAMTKAFLMNSARYMTGSGADDSLWSDSQGMGEMNLGTAFDGTARYLQDEISSNTFTASGQVRYFSGAVADSTKPFRVTIAWTDAPGSTTGHAYNNDLDLTVSVGGATYKGNVFDKEYSVAGGAADTRDNVESVFLPAGVVGSFTITVTAANINSVGVPNSADDINQDFALVAYNATAVSQEDALAPTLIKPAAGTLTNRSQIQITGSGEAGSPVTVYDISADNTTNVLVTTTVNSQGNFTATATLANGTNLLFATETENDTTSGASETVTIIDYLAPAILQQPVNQTNFLHGAATFSAEILGAAPLKIIWQKDGVNIPGATRATYTVANISDSAVGTYSVTAVNVYGSAASSNATLTLVANPFTNLTGAYAGLFTETNAQFASSGLLSLNLTTLGRFTGRILSAGGVYPISGSLSGVGWFSNAVARGAGKTPLDVVLTLNVTNGSNQILGTVAASNWVATLAANRAGYGHTNLFPAPGRFTFVLGNSNTVPTGPAGRGYGQATVNQNGLVVLSGTLPDNTLFSAVPVNISQEGTWPVYAALGRYGSLECWLSLTNQGLSVINFSNAAPCSFAGSNGMWFRTNTDGKIYSGGFSNAFSLMGSTFVASDNAAVLALPDLQVILSEGDLTGAVTNGVIPASSGKFTVNGLGIPNLVLTLNPASGLLQGRFDDASSVAPAQIKGIVFQQQTNGAGFFYDITSGGNFGLTPP